MFKPHLVASMNTTTLSIEAISGVDERGGLIMTKNEVISELNEIMALTGATEIKQGRVLDEFLKRHPNGRSISKDVYDNTIAKIYFNPLECVYAIKPIPNSHDTMIKRTKESEWERYSNW